MKAETGKGGSGPRWSWARLLLIIPFIGAMAVPYFNRVEPVLLGFPFFYWFQMVLVVVGAGLIGLVLLIEG